MSPDQTQMKLIKLKVFLSQCFGEYGSWLVLSLVENHSNKPLLYIITQKVMLDINMLGMLVVNQVFGYVHYTSIITLDGIQLTITLKSRSYCSIQRS